jgi:hypothetical protein
LTRLFQGGCFGVLKEERQSHAYAKFLSLYSGLSDASRKQTFTYEKMFLIVKRVEVLRTIQAYAELKGLRFLVIGGHAVNCFGLARQTGDIDLLVEGDNASNWTELLVKLDYRPGQNDSRFARFRSSYLAAWPIDLMFVDSSTFEKMYAESLTFEIGVSRVKVVSARHLVVLKLHALKVYQESRYLKDYNDLTGLMRAGKAVFEESEFRDLCVRYASLELFNKVSAELKLWKIEKNQ